MIRRRLLPELPGLTRFYGLKPWDWERLTFDEAAELVGQYRAHVEAERTAQHGRS